MSDDDVRIREYDTRPNEDWTLQEAHHRKLYEDITRGLREVANPELDVSQPKYEAMIICVCDGRYLFYTNDPVVDREASDALNVFCPYCRMRVRNAAFLLMHSGWVFNAIMDLRYNKRVL